MTLRLIYNINIIVLALYEFLFFYMLMYVKSLDKEIDAIECYNDQLHLAFCLRSQAIKTRDMTFSWMIIFCVTSWVLLFLIYIV